MGVFQHEGKAYDLDEFGFLLDSETWDEDFAEGMAKELGMSGELTGEHWKAIHFIREYFRRAGECPLVYQTCRAQGLRMRAFRRLFPTGYQRGACRLAGITYRDRTINYYGEAQAITRAGASATPREDKVYGVNLQGFLVDPAEWDPAFADHKARELGLRGGLTDHHWHVIEHLRRAAEATGRVPTVAEACEGAGLELEELEELFPMGYHRGAVKIAGLLVRV